MNKLGTIGWFDLTVANATTVRDFYTAVAGWTPEALSMGSYDDYVMKTPAGSSVAGICHARGSNAKIPPQWLLYIIVADVNASAQTAIELGGQVIDGPRPMGDGQFAIVRDPAGAVAALYQPTQPAQSESSIP
ncbi:MAG: VOC family protein [Gemmataceae bacterium]